MPHRSLVPVVGWCAATLSSVALASVAMLPVLRTATPDESSLVSMEKLRDSGEVQPAPLPPPATSPAAEPEPEPGATTTARTRRTTEPTAGDATTTTAGATRPSRPKTTTPAAPDAPSTTTTEDGWTVTTDGDGDKSFVRSFRVEGGSAVIRVTEDNVKVVTATPSDGFSVATVQNSPDNLAVYFNEVNHSFVIHVVWNVDKPFAEVSEIGR